MTQPLTQIAERSIRIAARPEAVFEFFVDPEKLARWLGPATALDARPGGALRVAVEGVHHVRGEFVEVGRPFRLVFTWGWERPEYGMPAGGCRVEVDMTPDGDGTLVRVRHLGLIGNPTEYAEGWGQHLERLAAEAASESAGTGVSSAAGGEDWAARPHVERQVRIEARPEIVFRYFTDPERMARWIGPVLEFDPRPGGTVRLLVDGVHPNSGRVVEVDPPRRIVFTSGWDEPGHPIPSGSTRVEVDLAPDGDGTLLRLRQFGLPTDAVADHSEGWAYYMNRLAVVVVGGDPGPFSSEVEAVRAGANG